MIYRKLKRTWTNGYFNLSKFRTVFPELSGVNNEEMADRFIALNMDFYYEKKKPVSFITRLTLPFALIIMFFMVIGLPITFMVTGSWGYSLNEKNRLLNWFRSLRLQ